MLKKRSRLYRNETISRRRDTCLIMTRKRYPWEKGWQFADLSARLPRICLESPGPVSTRRACNARHTQVTAPTVKLIFSRGEGEREGIPPAKDTDTQPSPWLSHLWSDSCSLAQWPEKKSGVFAEIFELLNIILYYFIIFLNIFF